VTITPSGASATCERPGDADRKHFLAGSAAATNNLGIAVIGVSVASATRIIAIFASAANASLSAPPTSL